MKKYLLFVVTAVIAVACGTKKEELVDQIAFNTYGEEITADDAQSMAALDEQLAENDSILVKVKAVIEKTCEKKGCWMTVTDTEGNEMRVTFKDYGFFVPTEGAEGKEVVFSGYAHRKTTDVDLLKHFAEDAGKSQEEIDAITEPKVELTFVADGVIIYEKEEKSEE